VLTFALLCIPVLELEFAETETPVSAFILLAVMLSIICTSSTVAPLTNI